MKKIIILLSTLFLISFITGCDSDPTYIENWQKDWGFATYKTSHGDKTLDKFYYENEENIPSDAVEAKIYSHSYTVKNPRCKMIVQEFMEDLDDEDIKYYTIDESDYEFLDDKPQNLLGFWVYVDGTNIYVVNDLYSDGFRDLKTRERPSAATRRNDPTYYRFRIYFNGALNYDFEMVEESSKRWSSR